jgi:hypothetical protein
VSLNNLYLDQSKSPPISASSSTGSGAFYYFFLGASLTASLAAGLDSATGALDPAETDPKKELTLFPFKALATALTKPAETLTPEAVRTAFNEVALT